MGGVLQELDHKTVINKALLRVGKGYSVVQSLILVSNLAEQAPFQPRFYSDGRNDC